TAQSFRNAPVDRPPTAAGEQTASLRQRSPWPQSGVRRSGTQSGEVSGTDCLGMANLQWQSQVASDTRSARTSASANSTAIDFGCECRGKTASPCGNHETAQ